jgi:hypothetical protein
MASWSKTLRMAQTISGALAVPRLHTRMFSRYPRLQIGILLEFMRTPLDTVGALLVLKVNIRMTVRTVTATYTKTMERKLARSVQLAITPTTCILLSASSVDGANIRPQLVWITPTSA